MASRMMARLRDCRDADDVEVTDRFDDATLCGKAYFFSCSEPNASRSGEDTFEAFPASRLAEKHV